LKERLYNILTHSVKILLLVAFDFFSFHFKITKCGEHSLNTLINSSILLQKAHDFGEKLKDKIKSIDGWLMR
jgi:hypothetical protein